MCTMIITTEWQTQVLVEIIWENILQNEILNNKKEKMNYLMHFIHISSNMLYFKII
jgi:hypothetical protein